MVFDGIINWIRINDTRSAVSLENGALIDSGFDITYVYTVVA